jgi:hypothetical protein
MEDYIYKKLGTETLYISWMGFELKNIKQKKKGSVLDFGLFISEDIPTCSKAIRTVTEVFRLRRMFRSRPLLNCCLCQE